MRQGRFPDSSTRTGRENRVVRGPRVVRDEASGEVITIVERRADGVAGARRPACLLFCTERGFTRHWDYPENWDDLSDAELVRISERPRRSRSA